MVALRAVCVFCGSSAPADPRYRDAARALGALLALAIVGATYAWGAMHMLLASRALAAELPELRPVPTALR